VNLLATDGVLDHRFGIGHRDGRRFPPAAAPGGSRPTSGSATFTSSPIGVRWVVRWAQCGLCGPRFAVPAFRGPGPHRFDRNQSFLRALAAVSCPTSGGRDDRGSSAAQRSAW
jgi:hypothetical protein